MPDQTTYVAERNLRPSDDPQPIRSSLIDSYFHGFNGEFYESRIRSN